MALPPTRWGGWVGLVAGVMYLLAGILILMAPPQTLFNSFSDYLSEVILVRAFGLTLVTVVGLYTLQRGRYGLLGAVGSLITFIGYVLIAVITAVSILVEAKFSSLFDS
jgi:drug/metabolite transporter (DMT)-like permease